MSKAYQLVVAICFAVPSLQLALKYLGVWRAPLDAREGSAVRSTIASLGIEFLHLFATMVLLMFLYQSPAGPGFVTLCAIALHILLVIGTSRKFTGQIRRELIVFVVLRGTALVLGSAVDARDFLLLHTSIALFIFIPLMFFSLMLPVPRWGVTEEVAAQIVDPKAVGAWEKQPHRGLFAGVAYFLVLGLFESLLLSRVDPTEFLRR